MTEKVIDESNRIRLTLNVKNKKILQNQLDVDDYNLHFSNSETNLSRYWRIQIIIDIWDDFFVLQSRIE